MLLFYIEALACLAFTIFLYFRFAMKDIRIYISVINIIVWFFTFSLTVLIPFDILLNSRQMKGQVTESLEEELNFVKIIYNLIYWTIFILSWIIIPLAQEFEKAGDFTFKDRLIRAVKTNLYLYLIFLAGGVAFLIYLVVKQQLTGDKLATFLILLSNAWGIFIIIFMLGYGLVAVPKHTWKLSDYKTRVTYLEFCAGQCKENLEERNLELLSCVQRLKYMKGYVDRDQSNPYKEYFEIIWNDVAALQSQVPSDSGMDDMRINSLNKFYKELTKLNKKVKKITYDNLRLKCEMEEIYKEWIQLQILLGIIKTSTDYNQTCCSRTWKFYYLKIRPWMLKISAIFFIILSLSTLISEITLYIDVPLSFFSLLIERTENIYLLNLLCLMPICFMFLSSLYGLFQVKLSGFYSIHDNRHTNSTSLLFLANFMCRIAFPLCLNFVQMLKLKNVNTVIVGMMGQTPDLGKHFFVFFPTILIILCLFNLFNVYGRLMNFLGFNIFGFKGSQNDDKIEEGNDALNRMKIAFEREKANKIVDSQSDNDLISKLIDSDVKLVVRSPIN